MAYFQPYIDASGLHIPAYEDILAEMINQFQGLYGQNVYLGNDSADYQWISVVSLKINDTLQAMQIVYNNRGPSTAVGAGLDGIVKLNGIARKLPSNSNVLLLCTGIPGTVVTNGAAQDQNGLLWNLPSSFTIGAGGNIPINAVCQQPGAISADPGTITIIATPTAGWKQVTNQSAATLGEPVEPDSALRARQALSVALPSQTRLQATIGAIAAVPGVTRWNVIENYTNQVDLWGTPPHSISCVVEGGADQDVAMAIYMNRSIGCYTNGTTTVVINDPVSGWPTPIRFSRPTYIPIQVFIWIHILNASDAILGQVQTAAVTYLNSLQIGEVLTISGLSAAIMQLNANLDNPTFSINLLRLGYSSITITAIINQPGHGYSVGDVLIVNEQNSPNTAQVWAWQLDPNTGAIQRISWVQQGIGYVSETNVPLTYPPGTVLPVLPGGSWNILTISYVPPVPSIPQPHIEIIPGGTTPPPGTIITLAGLTAHPELNGFQTVLLAAEGAMILVPPVGYNSPYYSDIPETGTVTTPNITGGGTGATVDLTVGAGQDTVDIAMAYYQVTQGIAANVTVIKV